ncbi:prephenate dehydratase [Granulicella sibirica]|uniref:Prephenate dehydratase n=1 Tax=Granulicella sibirica TaxID=2479048 RepID=A0A4Q0T0D1_9BACT|nr:prephenate dehydratase [Granulicella sibirica]RXH57015.1 Prephenate dehydratase [Granulicella sibirica]
MKNDRIAIQGELGSNSHMAALAMLGEMEIVPCALSAEVFNRVVSGDVDGAVLPIENSLHGSVAEHYDLLLERPVEVRAESMLRIRHCVIATPGVRLEEVRRVMSHPVALSQCRRWLHAHPEIEVVPFYDTAGSVKRLMSDGLRDAAGIAPELAARQYGAEILVGGIEDHVENFTRFYLLGREGGLGVKAPGEGVPDKMSLAFSLEHRPGTLVAALELLAAAGVNLTKIESRPVISHPWEYIFHVDVRFENAGLADAAVEAMRRHCGRLKVLGRYRGA